MIIDLILDRIDGKAYDPHDFYMKCLRYGEISHDITAAMDYGTDSDVTHAICGYLTDGDYNPELRDVVRGLSWLIPDDGVRYVVTKQYEDDNVQWVYRGDDGYTALASYIRAKDSGAYWVSLNDRQDWSRCRECIGGEETIH